MNTETRSLLTWNILHFPGLLRADHVAIFLHIWVQVQLYEIWNDLDIEVQKLMSNIDLH